MRQAANGGKLIVLSAPLTETIDHAGFFIQMGVASMPKRLESIFNSKYPQWKQVERNEDGSARYMPAGLRTLEAALLREYPPEEIVACYPNDLERFIGPRTRLVAVSTHNPLGVTFAAGVYASIFGSSREPINSHYARELFAGINANPHRSGFQVIVGGSGGWQIVQTDSYGQLGVDCVVEGRGESPDTMRIVRQAIRGEPLPRHLETGPLKDREDILIPEKRTTFGVVEMTTGCGRRCHFCVPDLSPQIDVPKEKIMRAVQANVRQGNRQISLATEDLFIWGQVRTGVPFYFPNREALLGLFSEVANAPGVEHHLLSHATIAPAVVDPLLIEKLTEVLLDKSPIHLPAHSTHPRKKILSPLMGLETGSVRMARAIMPGKAVPFPIDDWPSVVIQGLTILNRNNWFPVMTLMIGSPGETDEDAIATLDLVYEIERRGLFAFLVPSIFTPLCDTRMEKKRGVAETRELTPLQWQLMMKCWRMNLSPGLYSWWGPPAWRLGAVALWLCRLRRLNGPAFTWPLLLFAGAIPERLMARMGKIYAGRPLRVKSRRELLAAIKPHHRKHLRADNGDLPDTE
ncbi:MAG: B12-binding domain-containing radical SAM protein [Acidobacteria bacterium]|nr:B12-binding domain-containing radical SAM protein [Acidobacteriota bacterium]